MSVPEIRDLLSLPHRQIIESRGVNCVLDIYRPTELP